MGTLWFGASSYSGVCQPNFWHGLRRRGLTPKFEDGSTLASKKLKPHKRFITVQEGSRSHGGFLRPAVSSIGKASSNVSPSSVKRFGEVFGHFCEALILSRTWDRLSIFDRSRAITLPNAALAGRRRVKTIPNKRERTRAPKRQPGALVSSGCSRDPTSKGWEEEVKLYHPA